MSSVKITVVHSQRMLTLELSKGLKISQQHREKHTEKTLFQHKPLKCLSN